MKYSMKASTIILGALLVVSINSCSKSDSDGTVTPPPPVTVNCSGVNPSFSAEVFPLIQAKCATSSCHNAGSTNKGGPLTSYDLINAKSATIKAQVTSGAMPQTGTLSTAEKNAIICWVNNGAANN
ncbi:MAG: hypothetical protein V4717_05545 [Bacteroidota bacterium]